MVLDSVHRVACATDMVQSQSWEPVPVEAAVKTGKCGWYIVQVLLSAAPAENPQDKVRNTSMKVSAPYFPASIFIHCHADSRTTPLKEWRDLGCAHSFTSESKRSDGFSFSIL